MSQSDRGSFRNKESLFKEFRRTCLGRLIIGMAILAVLALIAWLSNPSKETMAQKIDDDINEWIQWVQEEGSQDTDWIDDVVNNAVFTFTTADSVLTPEQQEVKELFDNCNKEYCDYRLFSTMKIYSGKYIDGKHCGIGLFGLVIPIVNFYDILPRDGIMWKEYKKPTPQIMDNDEYFGENPDLGGVFRYNGE